MNSTKLSETVKDWYYNFFDSFEPDKQVIADIHNIDYQRKGDIFVIDVRGRGWPRVATIEILEEKFQRDLSGFLEESEDYISDIIVSQAGEFFKGLGVDIYYSKREDSYIGIGAKDIPLSVRTIVSNFEQMISGFVNMALSHITTDKSLDQSMLEDPKYLSRVLLELTEKNIDLFYMFVNITILHKFKDRVEEMVTTEFSPESWARKLEPMVKDFIAQKALDDMCDRIKEVLKPIVKKRMEQYSGVMTNENFSTLFDSIFKDLEEDSHELTI